MAYVPGQSDGGLLLHPLGGGELRGGEDALVDGLGLEHAGEELDAVDGVDLGAADRVSSHVRQHSHHLQRKSSFSHANF